MLLLFVLFLTGVLVGLIAEYAYHWLMHDQPLLFHSRHHKEFFRLPPAVVAHNTRDLSALLLQAGLVLLAIAPLMLFLGVWPVLSVYAGAMWHLLFDYQVAHALIHDDTVLPGFIRNSRVFQWWRGCHFAHHFHHYHNPSGNFSVTCPLLDWLLGTYLPPRQHYPDLPLAMPKHKIVVPKETVLLAFGSTVDPKRFPSLIAPISKWSEVASIGRLDPGAEGPLGRHVYLRLKAGAVSEQVIGRLKTIPEVESAELATDHVLLN